MTPIERLQLKEKVLTDIFSVSPYFEALTDEEKRKIVRLSAFKPEAFFTVVKKDPNLKNAWENLSEEERRAFLEFLYKPAEAPLREPWLDPTTWLPIGAVRGIFTGSLKKGVEAVGGVAVGDIAGETAEATYEAITGKEAPFIVKLLADILSGISPSLAERLLKRVRPKTPKIKPKEVKTPEPVKEEVPEVKPEEAKTPEPASTKAEAPPEVKPETPEEPSVFVVGGIRFADPVKHPEIAKEQLEILTRLELAEGGKRITGIDELTGERRFLGIKSSFPEWIPEDLRDKKLVKKVLDYIYEGKPIPEKNTREKRLYSIIKDKLEEPIRREFEDVDTSTLFFSGGPSFEQILKAFREVVRATEDPLEKVEKSALDKLLQIDPSLAEAIKLAKEERVAQASRIKRFVLPQYEWLKQFPEGLKVYRAGQEYTNEFEKDIKRWGDRLGKILKEVKDLSPKDKEKIVDYLEGKTKDIPENLKSIGDEIRKFLDDIYAYAKEQGINIHYRENYFPHLFEGNIRVKVGDEYRQASTWEEALDIAKEGLEEGKDVKIKAFLRPDIYELKITEPRFWRLVRDLQHGVLLDADEIKEILREAGIGRRPRWRFVGNLLERKYNIEGYIKDPEVALNLYTFNILKKIHQDRFLKKFEEAYRSVIDSRLRKFLDDYKAQVLGYPTADEEAIADLVNSILSTPIGRVILKSLKKSTGERVTPFGVRRTLGFSNLYFNYVFDLGLSGSSALVNSTQFALNTASVLGVRAFKDGAKWLTKVLARDKKTLEELFEAGILTEAGFEGVTKGLVQRIADLPMAPFQAVELANRIATYGSAKEFAKREGVKGMLKVLDLLGVKENDPLIKLIKDPEVSFEKKAVEFAKEVVDRTQFRYEKFASPKVLSSSLGKLALPYKNFLVNQLLFSYRMLTKAKAHPKEALQFFATGVLLAGLPFGNPILSWTWEALSKVYEDMFGRSLEEDLKKKLGKVGEVLIEGIPRQLGFDIRSQVKIDVPHPLKPEEWMGRPFRIAWFYLRGEKERAKRELIPRIVKNIQEALDIAETGFLRDVEGRVIGPADKTDAFLRVLGFRPPEFYDFVETKANIREIEKIWQEEISPAIDRIIEARIKGDEEALAEAISDVLTILNDLKERVERSEGEVRKKYLFLYARLLNALKRQSLERRYRNKLIPFIGSDRKKVLLLERR